MGVHLNQSRRDGNQNAVLGVAILCATLGSVPVIATPPLSCHMRLGVELTPDVPDPQDPGFLSSLLDNHPGYRLILRRERTGSVIVLDLTGPGPRSQCQRVVDTLRRDGRVLSVHVRKDPS
jgi:hypothetical protein